MADAPRLEFPEKSPYYVEVLGDLPYYLPIPEDIILKLRDNGHTLDQVREAIEESTHSRSDHWEREADRRVKEAITLFERYSPLYPRPEAKH